MPKFMVTLEETVAYHIAVEAESEDEAGNAAEKILADAVDVSTFVYTVLGRQTSEIKKIGA